MFTEASSFCQRGLEQTPSSVEMKKLLMQIDSRRQEEENHKARLLESVAAAEVRYLGKVKHSYVCSVYCHNLFNLFRSFYLQLRIED